MSPPEFLRRLGSYPPGEWLWMLEAAILLAWARFLIRFVPFRHWRRWMGPIGPNAPQKPLSERDRIRVRLTHRWIKLVAARAPFRAVCLPQAMAARWMLAWRGIATDLHIGSRPAGDPSAAKPVDLHAWLLCGDRCLTGADQRAQFTAFTQPRERLGKA